MRQTYRKPPHSVVFSIPMLSCSSLAKKSSSAPYSQTTLACVLAYLCVTPLSNQVTQQAELTIQCCSIQRNSTTVKTSSTFVLPSASHPVMPTRHVIAPHNIAHHHVVPLQMFPVSCIAELCHSVSSYSCSELTYLHHGAQSFLRS